MRHSAVAQCGEDCRDEEEGSNLTKKPIQKKAASIKKTADVGSRIWDQKALASKLYTAIPASAATVEAV